MFRNSAFLIFYVFLGFLNIASCSEHDKVNGSIRINANEQVSDLDTVNGSIRIGAGAHAKHAETVNGSIHVESGAEVVSLETVNGSITLNDGVKVAQNVEAVNGSLVLDNNVDVSGRLSNVNGSIKLAAAHVGVGIETMNGDVTLGANARVEGGLSVEKPKNWFESNEKEERKPHIVIGPNAVIKGALVFKREVELFVSDSAIIDKVEGATPIKFSGDTLPLK